LATNFGRTTRATTNEGGTALDGLAHVFADALERVEAFLLDLGRQHLDLDARQVLGQRLAPGRLAARVRLDLLLIVGGPSVRNATRRTDTTCCAAARKTGGSKQAAEPTAGEILRMNGEVAQRAVPALKERCTGGLQERAKALQRASSLQRPRTERSRRASRTR
jgi:hypothetical protein